MSTANTQTYVCARRHQSRPSLFVESPSTRPICLPCAASTIRSQSSRPLRFSVASALANLTSSSLRSKSLSSNSANAALLDTLDALCFILCDSSEEDDHELVKAISSAISHICFSCDNGVAEPLGDGGDPYKVSRAVLNHVFQFLIDHVSDTLYDRRLRAVYAHLLSTMVHRSCMLSDQVTGDWKNAETFLSCFDLLQVDMRPWCRSLLEDLVDASGSCALDATTDVLCALLISGSETISSFLNENVCTVLNALQKATSINHREKLLSLIFLTVSSARNENKLSTSRKDRSRKGKQKNPESDISGAMLAEALKPCVISPSSAIRSLVAEIVTFLLEPELETRFSKCTGFLCSPASGFTDYLIESIRHPLKYISPDSQDCIQGSSSPRESELAAPILRILALIVTRFSLEMKPRWQYALPVLCKSALAGYDNEATEATFKLFQRGCSRWAALQNDIAHDIVQLFLRSGGRLRSALEAESTDLEAEKSCFLAGIDMLLELTENNCIPTSIGAELLECAECIGLLSPHVVSGSKFTYNALKLILETKFSSDVATTVKRVAVDIWGSYLATLLSKTASASREQLAFLLKVLCAALGIRLYESEVELRDVALPLFREINFAKVSAFHTQEHQNDELESDCGIGRSDALWGSSEHNLLRESNEGSLTPHTDDVEKWPAFADAVRAYFSRAICSLPDISNELGLKSALGYRVLERSMPLSVNAFIAQLSSPASPEKLLVSITVLWASIAHSQSTIAYPGLIQKALIDCVESTNLSEAASFRECVLPLVRMIFLCSDGMREVGNDVFIPKAVCAIALTQNQLDIVRLDSDFFFHVLSCHDTDLRVLAWNTFARSRIRGDPEWNAIDIRLADLLGRSTSTAKNFVSSCLEGSHDLRCIALDLMTIRPESVPIALLKVGLPSLIMKELEARAVLLSPPDPAARSLAEIESSELRLRDLIAMVTSAVKYGEQEDLRRMLMMLVDAYERGRTRDIVSSQMTAKDKTLDSAVLRCLIAALNAVGKPNKDQAFATSHSIVPYLLQTMSVSNMVEHLASAARRIMDDGSSCTQWNDEDEFGLQAVACALDYVARHQIRTFQANPSNEVAKNMSSWKSSGLSERDWIVLLFHTRVGTGHHAKNCRQTSCLKLLNTIVVHWILCKCSLAEAWPVQILGPSLLAMTVAAAVAPKGVFQSSARDFLLTLVTHEDDLFGKADLRLSNLASHEAFYSLMASKFAMYPNGLTLAELRYLASYSFRKFAPSSCKRIHLVQKVRAFSAIVHVSKAQEEAMCKAANALFSGAVGSRALSSKEAANLFHMVETALESASNRHLDVIHKAESSHLIHWNQDDLLIGTRAILAAPLSYPLPQASYNLDSDHS